MLHFTWQQLHAICLCEGEASTEECDAIVTTRTFLRWFKFPNKYMCLWFLELIAAEFTDATADFINISTKKTNLACFTSLDNNFMRSASWRWSRNARMLWRFRANLRSSFISPICLLNFLAFSSSSLFSFTFDAFLIAWHDRNQSKMMHECT